MSRRVVLTAVVLMLAVPIASAATYDQPGNGPERTGQIDFQGPQTNDTAFQVHLPGVPFSQPALIGDDLYLYTRDVAFFGYEGDTEDLTENALWRIDLTDGSVQRVMDLPFDQGIFTVDNAAISPDRVLLQDAGTGELVATQVPSGQELWRTKALPDDPRERRIYGDAVEVGGMLYVGFFAQRVEAEEAGRGVGFSTVLERIFGVVAVDPSTGQEAWTWTRTQAQAPETGLVGTETVSDRSVAAFAISADEERVYPYLLLSERLGYGGGVDEEYAGVDYGRRAYELHALDASDGSHLWNTSDTEQARAEVFSSQGDVGPDTFTDGGQCCAWPVVTQTRVTMRLDAFVALNPATGETIWASEAGRSDHIDLQGALGMGIRGDTLIGASSQTVYRLDAGEEGDIQWQETSPDRVYANEPIVLDEEVAYIPMHPLGDGDNFYDIGIEARDLDTGEVRWTWEHHPDVGFDSNRQQDSANPVFGPGVVVWPAKDGTVTVIGQTDASLGAPPVEGQMYPPAGEPMTLQVPEPDPGAFGPATRYMVDWGDGTVTGWQDDPVFTHTYAEERQLTASVIAANEANQTRSTVVTMHVGAEQPNWLSERFEPGNQDMTFGVLGILVAVTGGAIGVTRRYRKRSRLQEELEAVEQAFEATKDRPMECEAQLTERKTHARGLVLDGELDEQQFGVVEQRIEELLKGLRMGAMEDEFDFLPHGLVKRARQMLSDGTVTSLEREAFLMALEQDELLTSEQKSRVRERIEAWYARDAGGGGS